MKTQLILATCSVLTLSYAGGAAAGTLDPADVPASAEVVGHIDLDALRSSQLAKTFATELEAAKSELAGKLKSEGVPLEAKDIFNASSITFWAEGDDPESGALILSGIDQAKFVRALKKLPAHKDIGGGLHRVDDSFVGFAGSRMVVADDKKSIQATLKVLSGGGKSLAQTAKAKRLKNAGGVLLIAAFEEAIAKKIKKEAGSAIFSDVSLRRGTATFSEKNGSIVARAVLETTDAAGANQLHKLAAGGISFLTVASDNAALGKLLDGVDIKSSGTTVTFSLELPISELKNIAAGLDK